jgi:hypothetical protein
MLLCLILIAYAVIGAPLSVGKSQLTVTISLANEVVGELGLDGF